MEAIDRGIVKEALHTNTLVFFLGAGVNLCDREPDQKWPDDASLPSGLELSKYFAKYMIDKALDGAIEPDNPEDQDFVETVESSAKDLISTTQSLETTHGRGVLKRELRNIFLATAESTTVHKFLSDIQSLTSESPMAPIIVTTNYDTLMEDALEEVAYDLLVYSRKPKTTRYGFSHEIVNVDKIPAQQLEQISEWVDIEDGQYKEFVKNPVTYPYEFSELPVVLKIHGSIVGGKEDEFVITEDDYIRYLQNPDPNLIFPVHLLLRLQESHFLFLGYSLGDWNLRAILQNLWGDEGENQLQAWAVQKNPGRLEQKQWAKKNVDVLNEDLVELVGSLRRVLDLDTD